MSETKAATGALAGLKVIDLTRVLGGPYCTQIFADHGATVIKVEPPQGDEVRDWGPPFHDEDATYFLGLNRNKRSIGLDLTQEAGREVLFTLLEDADILIENLKPGTMERWGLGYEEVLKDRFPRLIHCRVSGYGSDGPLGGFPGYDAIIQAMTGWFSVNGTAGAGPTRVGIPMVDMGTGLYSAVGILMAVYERQRSGLGQYLDMTLYDCGISLMHPHVPNYAIGGQQPRLTGNAHPNVAPYDRFSTKTVDIFLGAGNNRAFQRLCTVLKKPELIEDPRYATPQERLANVDAMREDLEAAMADWDGEELSVALLEAGVPAGPVLDTAQMLERPHTKHRNMAVEMDWYKCSGIPIKMSRTPGSVRTLPPKYGEHTRAILEEHGIDAGRIDQLSADGIVIEKRKK